MRIGDTGGSSAVISFGRSRCAPARHRGLERAAVRLFHRRAAAYPPVARAPPMRDDAHDVTAEQLHALPAEAVAKKLAVDPHAGLSPEEAARRLQEIGPNELGAVTGRTTRRSPFASSRTRSSCSSWWPQRSRS